MKTIIIAVLQIVLNMILNAKKKLVKETKNPSIKKAQLKKIRNMLLVIVFVSIFSGCVTRVVYIEPGSSVRLRQPVKNCKVWVNVEGEWEEAIMTVPEGWYATYLTDDEINNGSK